MIQKVKGTQDFIDLSLFNFLTNNISKHLQEYNFTQIATPIIEYTDLFTRSLGLNTDVVSKEMFIINTQKNEDSICLRPEVTAPTVRAFIENSITQIPWKVFSVGPMFRYERPQKGRFRQFHQMNIEIIGSKSIYQDALFIKMLDQLFKKKFLLDTYAISINFLGCYQDRSAFNNKLKDFLDKLSEKICSTCNERKERNPLRIFDCKNEICKEIYQEAPHTTDYLCKECEIEWEQLQTTLDLISVSFIHANQLVRGLDYYDKTVFEFSSTNLGAQNAFCGGGRYDRLVNEINPKYNQPAIGAAIGIERLMLLVEPIKDKFNLEEKPVNYLIIPLTEQQSLLALLLSNELHTHNIGNDILLENASAQSLMRKANKMGTKYCLILGQKEQDNREVTVKNMITGQEITVKQIELCDYLNKL